MILALSSRARTLKVCRITEYPLCLAIEVTLCLTCSHLGHLHKNDGCASHMASRITDHLANHPTGHLISYGTSYLVRTSPVNTGLL